MELQMKSQVITTYRKRNMNVWTKCHGKQSNSCQDISLKTTNVKLMLALDDKSGDHQRL